MSNCPYFQATQLFTKSTKNILDLINIVKLGIKNPKFFKKSFLFILAVYSQKEKL